MEKFEPIPGRNERYGGIQRVRTESDETAAKMPESDGSHLSKEQRGALSQLVNKVRLRHLVYAAAIAGTFGVGAKAVKDYVNEINAPQPVAEGPQHPPMPSEISPDPDDFEGMVSSPAEEATAFPQGQETVEAYEGSEHFLALRAGWEEWWNLQYNQVLFVDEAGVPVGEPVDFREYVVKRTREGADGQPEEFDYLLTPGALNEEGMLADNLAGEWIRYVRAMHAEANGMESTDLEQRNITQEFEVAVARAADEPLLREQILSAVRGSGGIESMADIVRYYGMNPEKPVRGDAAERTRADFLREEIVFSGMPTLVEEELRSYIVGLAAQESRFNAGLPKNAMTAWGVMQTIDIVREEHGYDPATPLSFIEEVDVAGRHFSNIYTRLQFWMQHSFETDTDGERLERDTHERLRALFSSESDWQRYFLVPAMITAYNAGELNVGESLHAFVGAHTDEELREMMGDAPGYDLFMAYLHYARESNENRYTQQIGDDVESYFVSIAAISVALGERSSSGIENGSYQTAQVDE